VAVGEMEKAFYFWMKMVGNKDNTHWRSWGVIQLTLYL